MIDSSPATGIAEPAPQRREPARGRVSGVFTPTDAGGIACVYALFLGIVWYRDLRWSGIWTALKTLSRMNAILFLTVVAVAMLVLGTFLDPGPMVILFIPL